MRVLLCAVVVAMLPLRLAGAGEAVEAVLTVRGMFCSSCAGNVEKALRGLDGVSYARVEPTLDRVRVRYLPDRVTPRRMSEVLRKWGYDLQVPRQEEQRKVP
jgi:copper chaperone CopZ